MNRPEEIRRNSSALWLTLVVFALTLFFGQAQRAEAQQWTTNGNNINNTNPGNVGVGTASPEETLDVNGSFKRGVVRQFSLTRTIGGNAGDWVNIGDFANNGVAFYAKVYLYTHGPCIIASQAFQFDSTAYSGGASNTWIELAPTGPNSLYTGLQRVTVDVSNANRSVTTSPVTMRLRAKPGMCGSPTISVLVETNTTFTPSTTSGTGATTASGYLGSTGWSFPVASDVWTNTTQGLYVLGNGNVGIGTLSPGAKLHVSSASTTSQSVISASDSAGNGGNFLALWSGWSGGTPNHPALIWKAGTDLRLGGLTDMGTGAGFAEAMRVTSSGNVGIGTITPGQKLVVYGGADTALEIGDRGMSGSVGLQFLGSGYKHAAIRFDGDNLVVENASNTVLPSTWYNGQPMNLVIRNGNLNVAAGGLCLAGDCRTSWSQVGGGSSTAANVSAGQFGANTGGGNFSFPASVLLSSSAGAFIDSGANNRFRVCGPNGGCAVAGEYIGGRIRLSADGSFANAEAAADPGMGGINAPGNAYLGGNVGVGTTSPTRTLSVNAAATSYMSFNEAGAEKAVIGTEAAAPYNRRFIIYDSTAAAYRMVIDNTGKVGIGTTAPTAKLDVQGDINVTGNINAKYQDVAEWVIATHVMPAGTVVVLNPTRPNQVLASSKPYDTLVAGVVSQKPGLALGEAGPDKVLVATTGRVKVKVDATRSPIRIGDLLVTSDREGMAMKSEPITIGGRQIHAPGTLIGKALEPLEKGVGEVLVLLSLQ